MTRKVDRDRSPDHWILLDRSWAQRLGVRRAAGVYRIRSRELARRLSRETLWIDESGQIHSHGLQPAAACTDRGDARSQNVPVRGR